MGHKIWGERIFEFKTKFKVKKPFWIQKNLVPKKFCPNTIFVQKFWVKKNHGTKIFGSNKIEGQKDPCPERFRLKFQVRAECGNDEIILKLNTKSGKVLAEDSFIFSYFYILKIFTSILLTRNGINLILYWLQGLIERLLVELWYWMWEEQCTRSGGRL